MDTRSVDTDEAVARLSTDARQWLVRHAGYLDSAAGHARLPLTPRVKALLQLALLRHYWAGTRPADEGLRAVTEIVEGAWRRPDFPHVERLDPRYGKQLGFILAALAPPGVEPARAALDRYVANGYLTPHRKSHYLRLETRFHADLAGVPHQLAAYAELYAASLLARCHTLPIDELDVCEITHSVFYLSDFGRRDPGLTGDDLTRARDVVRRLTEISVRGGTWDHAAKLVLAQHCLGQRPTRTASGAAAIHMLDAARTADGAIPGKAAAARTAPTATEEWRFRDAYQPTLGTALATLLITGGQTAAPAPAGGAAEREAR
ncbi:hypothetical protein [Streptomyces sp. NBRC 109706]|uniref:DUF6895 family protein n=1 Tax=Streptomyces sp. NBRC 109706 TaxID=1550035 RepID=UPI0007854218|nr:hypothetical protein [Streptomyces sp. NBRC 109706]